MSHLNFGEEKKEFVTLVNKIGWEKL